MVETIPRKLQQNGVAERMNRTLNKRVRSMRLHAGLPKMFWVEGVNTVAYLINRGPSTPPNGRIPEEVWSSKAVNLSFLKIFGCLSYVHIDACARSKLDAKSKHCFFVGYGDAEFGYRLWDDQNQKVIRSKDVIFNEEVPYNDRLKVETRGSVSETKKTKTVPLGDIFVNEEEHTRIEDLENIALKEVQ